MKLFEKGHSSFTAEMLHAVYVVVERKVKLFGLKLNAFDALVESDIDILMFVAVRVVDTDLNSSLRNLLS